MALGLQLAACPLLGLTSQSSGAAVGGVGCGDAVDSGFLHDHRAVTALGEEVMMARVLIAVLQLRAGDGGRSFR